LVLLLLLLALSLANALHPGFVKATRRTLPTTKITSTTSTSSSSNKSLGSSTTRRAAAAVSDETGEQQGDDDDDDILGKSIEDLVAEEVPACFVILSNLQSGSNIGAICRNALSFNVKEVIVIGPKNGHKEKMRGADRGAKSRLKFVNFSQTSDALTYLRQEKKVDAVIGVEIANEALSVAAVPSPFKTRTAFMFGNEGTGLSARQREQCDYFVYIPQYGQGMASINVACCSAIILHSFALWARYEESKREGEKFV